MTMSLSQKENNQRVFAAEWDEENSEARRTGIQPRQDDLDQALVCMGPL